jgi:pyruvate formate lyase activating enzyme
MVIGGFQKFSMSDFPGLISAIVFTRGCGFRCPYCHNPELVDPSRYASEICRNDVMDFLRSRQGRLQGVVVTGGEPTIHEDLPQFLADLKAMGFAVKLDTNGTSPRTLQKVLEVGLVDFIAMDIKAPPSLYERTVKAPVSMPDIIRSVGLILASGLPHEFRTTFVESLLSVRDILSIARLVKGCDRYVLQPFRGGATLDDSFTAELPPDPARLQEIVEAFSAAGLTVDTR